MNYNQLLRRTLLGFLLIFVMMLAVACGGDEDDETKDNDSKATDVSDDNGDSATDTPVPADETVNLEDYPLDGSFDPRTVDFAAVGDTQSDLYGWQLFLNISEFQTGIPGSPTLWQTWRQTTTVYLDCGAQPAPWGTTEAVPEEVITAAEEQGLASTDFYTYVPFDQQIDGRILEDVNGVPVRYEVRMNESTFNTIFGNQFYNRDNQVAFFNNSSAQPLQFNTDALEVKATWLIFADGQSQTDFYTTTAYWYDENGALQVKSAGLTGLHITSKVTPNWFWVTFEQKDNEQTTGIKAVTPISPTTQAVNEQVHNGLPADSVWRNYNLRGTQWEFTDPVLLANTQIETYVQASSSCITCHFTANIGNEQNGRLFFFEFVDGNLQGYTGDPASIQFQTDDSFVTYNNNFGFVDSNNTLLYKQLDFVWSLREAQPSCTTESE